jgi:type VI secretion system protein VasG
MSAISRASLFGKLNAILYQRIEAATVFAKLRGNPRVELSHWLYQLLQLDDSDLHRIIRGLDLDPGGMLAHLLRELERLPTGALGIEDLSGDIDLAVERGWMHASVGYASTAVRSGHLLVALLSEPRLREVVVALSPEFGRIDARVLRERFASLVAGSPEQQSGAAEGEYGGELAAPGESSGAMAPAALGRQEAVKKYTVDLTERARAGEIDPVTGRDDEIRQIVDILMRRRQNNPILTGEAGVGKTAVVEGLALRIAEGDVPPSLREVELRTLDIGLLQAGASMKGEFEQRLRQLIDEVQHAERPVVLFIDEIHTLVGAGGAAGTGDAANLLKPALARGTLRTIGATTWSEYKKYIEKDPALTRRFQLVQVHEPDERGATAMLRGVVPPLENHHGVRILDDAVRAAVVLSHRYIPARQLPDKAVALLDTAAARVAISQHTTPPELDDCRRRIDIHEKERALLLREQAAGLNHTARLADIEATVAAQRVREHELAERWSAEQALVDRITSLRDAVFDALDGKAADRTDDTTPPDHQQELAELERTLRETRGERALVSPAVDEQAVAAVVADWTGIPVGRMVRNQAREVIELADNLEQRVIGQRHGLETISRRIQTSRARLSDPNKPVGVFMLCGPSGVGKTETALSLAECLYGGEQNLITINMSEFQEAHTVSTLKGAPPGYVGYGEGGVLTEAVRRRPYSVVLLDEVEKAHPDVHEIFYQVFDKGRMEDGEGRQIDFRNTIILLTSNIGTDTTAELCRDPDALPEPDAIVEALRPELLEVFPPALLGRLVVVPYRPLSPETLRSIVTLQLERIRKRLAETHGAGFEYDDAALELIIAKCNVAESGGRMIDAVLTNSVLPQISRRYLEGLVEGRTMTHIRLSSDGHEFVYDIATVAIEAAHGAAADRGAAGSTPDQAPLCTDQLAEAEG